MNWNEELVKEYIFSNDILNPGKVKVLYNSLVEISRVDVVRKGLDEVDELANNALDSFLDKERIYKRVNDKDFINKITCDKVVTLLTALEVIANGDPISVEPDEISDLAQLAIDYFNK